MLKGKSTVLRDKASTRTRLKYGIDVEIIRGLKVTVITMLKTNEKSRQHARKDG